MLQKQIKEDKKDIDFSIFLGGDHSMSMGTISGQFINYTKDKCVIWLDAHTDCNNIKYSQTGSIHGMPVSALLGDLEEPFVVKERTPDSDDITSSDENEDTSEKDKNMEDSPLPLPIIDPETTAHPITKDASIRPSNIKSHISILMPTLANQKCFDRYENLFADEKQSIADSGSDIIHKIKLAEKIYDNNTEDDDRF